METRKVIEALYEAYGARDLERTSSFVSDGFEWNVPIDAGEAPYGEKRHGVAAMLDRMRQLDATFDYLGVSPQEFIVDGDQAAVRVIFRLRDKAGGEEFDLDVCHFWHVENGKCTKVTEVYDTGLMSKCMVCAD